MSSKSRDLTIKLPGGILRAKNGGIITDYSNQFRLARGAQVTESEGHRRNPKTGKYDEGGPFYTCKTHYEVPTIEGTTTSWRNTPQEKTLTGRFHTPLPGEPESIDMTHPTTFRPKDTSGLTPKGTTAIAQVAPTNSHAVLATTLGEIIKERRLPSIPGIQTWKERTRLAKAAGSEYLNYIFGWVPLVSDVTDASKAISRSAQLLKEHKSGALKTTRREFHFPTEVSSASTIVSKEAWPECGPGLPQAEEGAKPGLLVTSVETEVRTWFSGSFAYPPLDQNDSWQSVLDYGSKADYLLGTTLTPDVLWELTPWSWAIDWFSNTGDVIHNVSEFSLHGLTMQYGYIMEEKRTITTNTLVGLSGMPTPPPSKLIQVSKVRREASPFGFGVSWEGLSPTQLAITAALGITRLR